MARRHRLIERRKTMGMSQERLAEAVGVDASTVARWERGETEPLPFHRPRLAEALKVTAEEVGELLLAGGVVDIALTDAPDPREVDVIGRVSSYLAARGTEAPYERRSLLLQGVAAIAVACGLVGSPVSPDARRLGPNDIDRLNAITELYRSMDCEHGGGMLYQQVARFAEAAAALLDWSYPERLAPNLLRAVANARRVAGWTAFDALRHSDAQRHLLAAERAAVAADDPLLAARIRYCQARQFQYLRHNRDALETLRLARDQLGGRATPAVSAMLLGTEAASLAALGDQSAAVAALGKASDAFERIDPVREPEFMRYYGRSDLLQQYCRSYLGLAHDDPAHGRAAVAWATEELPAHDPGNLRGTVMAEVRRCSALFLADEPEQALTTGMRVIDQAAQLVSPRTLDRLRNVRRDLARHKSLPEVATFAHTLSTIKPTQAP